MWDIWDFDTTSLYLIIFWYIFFRHKKNLQGWDIIPCRLILVESGGLTHNFPIFSAWFYMLLTENHTHTLWDIRKITCYLPYQSTRIMLSDPYRCNFLMAKMHQKSAYSNKQTILNDIICLFPYFVSSSCREFAFVFLFFIFFRKTHMK